MSSNASAFDDVKPKKGYGLVYRYLFDDGKSYIGQTTKSLLERHLSHHNPKHPVDVQIMSQGFELEVLAEVPIEDLDSAEEYYIKAYNTLSPNGYNYTTGGIKSNRMCDETKKKISESRMGIQYSEETRKRMSESHMGLEPWNKGTKGVMKAWNKGLSKADGSLQNYELKGPKRPSQKKDPETVHRNRSEAQKGRIVSEETRHKISESLKGYPQSEETRKKRSESLKGRTRPPEVMEAVRRTNIERGNYCRVQCVETGIIYESLNEAERQTGVCASNISAVLKGRLKSAGKYHWVIPCSCSEGGKEEQSHE